MRVLLVALAVLALCGCGAGSGTRAPSSSERAQLVHAMRFWWKNSDAFAAVRNLPLHIGAIRIARRDGHYATMRIGTTGAESQLLGYLRLGGVWEIVVGPGDWSGVCTSPSPKPFTDLFCRPASRRR